MLWWVFFSGAEWHCHIFNLGVVAKWSKVLTAVTWAHISSGLYPGCFMASFHSYISFHFTLWVARVPLESPYHIICIYSIFGLQIIYIKIFYFKFEGVRKISCDWSPFLTFSNPVMSFLLSTWSYRPPLLAEKNRVVSITFSFRDNVTYTGPNISLKYVIWPFWSI